MTMLAARLPIAIGVNTAEIVQLELGARLIVQVFVWIKSAELAPPRAILLMLKAAVPELLKLTLCGALLLCNVWLPKLIDEELRTACDTPWPIPLRVIV